MQGCRTSAQVHVGLVGRATAMRRDTRQHLRSGGASSDLDLNLVALKLSDRAMFKTTKVYIADDDPPQQSGAVLDPFSLRVVSCCGQS